MPLETEELHDRWFLTWEVRVLWRSFFKKEVWTSLSPLSSEPLSFYWPFSSSLELWMCSLYSLKTFVVMRESKSHCLGLRVSDRKLLSSTLMMASSSKKKYASSQLTQSLLMSYVGSLYFYEPLGGSPYLRLKLCFITLQRVVSLGIVTVDVTLWRSFVTLFVTVKCDGVTVWRSFVTLVTVSVAPPRPCASHFLTSFIVIPRIPCDCR